MTRVFAFLAATLLASAAFAAERTRIFVEAAGSDNAGTRLATSLRDQIARSPRYILANGPKDALFMLYVTTLDPDGGGLHTAFAFTLTRYRASVSPSGVHEVFELQNVGVCGRRQIDSCASRVLATVDTYVVALRPTIEAETANLISAANELIRQKEKRNRLVN
jgi:hypothetical protein